MHVSRKVNPSDKSKLNENGVVAIDKSINSLINFLDKLLKCIHDTLDQLENYYQTYMSAVQSGLDWNVHEKTSHNQKKIDSKYNHIKNQLEDFMICIVKDYAEFIQDGYEIRTLHENYDFYINYLQKISLDDKKFDDLNILIPKAEQIKKKIDKLVIQYNAEVTKLSYLKLNLRYRVIVYRSSFTGQSFSIPINILIRNFKNLIQFNKLVVIADQIHSSLLEQPLSNIENLSQEPELIYARSVNLDPLINITRVESRQTSSAKPPRPESPPEEPPRPKLSSIKNLLKRPELIYARSVNAVNLDPLINITRVESRQPSSAKPSRPEFPPEESSRPKLSRKESLQTEPPKQEFSQESTQQEPSRRKLPRQKPPQQEPLRVETPVGDATTPVAEAESLEAAQPTEGDTTSAAPMPVDLPLTAVRKRKIDLTSKDVESSQQEHPPAKVNIKPVAKPLSAEVSGVTEPISSETGRSSEGDTTSMPVDLLLTAVKKRKPDLTTPEDVEPQSLGVDKSDENKIKQKRTGSSDETKSTVESEIDVTTTEGVPVDTPSMPSLRDELLEAERLSSLSSSSSQIQPQPRKGILKQKFKRKLEQKQKKSSRKVPMKIKKPGPKIRYVPTKPIPELIAIDKQKIITKEFYDKIFKKLESNISKIEVWENNKIVDKNNDLCKMYHIVQRQLNNRRKDLENTEQEIEEIRKSGIQSKKVQENLKKKEEMIEKFKIVIIDNELETRKIKYQVQILDKQDHDLQIYKNILYDVQRHLCQRWLEQLNKSLALETDVKKMQELRTDIRKVKNRIENIFSEIKDLHPSYILRKKRRMPSGPYKANFCIKQTLDADIWGRKYGGKEYRPDLVDDPLAEKEEEPMRKIIPTSAPTNILIPKRKP